MTEATDAPAEEPKKKNENPYERLPVAIGEDGRMLGLDLDKLWRVSTMIYRGGFFPQFPNAEAVAVVLWAGHRRGYDPVRALQSFYRTEGGGLALFGDAPRADARAHPRWGSEEEWYELDGKRLEARPAYSSWEDYPEAFTACWQATFADGTKGEVSRFSVADAIVAKLWPTTSTRKSSSWNTYPWRKLRWEARHFGLRDAFPEVYAGAPLEDPVDHAAWAETEETDAKPKATVSGDDFEKARESISKAVPTVPPPAAIEGEEEETKRDERYVPPKDPAEGQEWTPATSGVTYVYQGGIWKPKDGKPRPQTSAIAANAAKIEWDGYPIRKARKDKDDCVLCGEKIERGDRFFDGNSPMRIAHEKCVAALAVKEKLDAPSGDAPPPDDPDVPPVDEPPADPEAEEREEETREDLDAEAAAAREVEEDARESVEEAPREPTVSELGDPAYTPPEPAKIPADLVAEIENLLATRFLSLGDAKKIAKGLFGEAFTGKMTEAQGRELVRVLRGEPSKWRELLEGGNGR